MKYPHLMILASLIILGILFSGCITDPIPTPTPAPIREGFFEIVFQTPTSSTEYFATSNGYVQKKVRSDLANLQKSTIEISRQSNSTILAELELISKNMPLINSPECSDCQSYTFFFSDGKNSKANFARSNDASAFTKETYAKAQELFERGEPEETFFIQLVFIYLGSTFDYHIFRDGTVILSIFGEKTTDLKAVQIMKIPPTILEGLLTDEFFDSQGSLDSCTKYGYDFGYIEGAFQDKYALIQTCGEGNSAADLAFNKLLKVFLEK